MLYKKITIYNKLKSLFIKQNPKISVIVASYNYQDFIKETLDSLMAQTYKNFEVIVVDDGSRDNSLNVIKEYIEKYDNIFLYTHENNMNQGLSKTIQLALTKSSGVYIAFCESDDYWTPNHLEEKIKIINTHPNTPFILNYLHLVGSPTKQVESYIQDCEKSHRRNSYKLKILKNSFNNIPTFSCVMIKKSILVELDFNSFIIPPWLDWWLWRQVLAKYPMYVLDKHLTYWRIHTSYNSEEKSKEYGKKLDEFLLLNNFLIAQRNFLFRLKFQKKIKKNQDLIKILRSKYFDEKWFCQQYKLPPYSRLMAAMYYLESAWKNGCDCPSEKFNGKIYLHLYQDIKNANLNPLLHFERSGKKERRVAVAVSEKPIVFNNRTNTNAFENILLVSHMLNYTGAPVLLLQVAKMLLEENYNVYVLSPEDGKLRDDFISIGVCVIIDPYAYIISERAEFYDKFNFKFALCNTYLCAKTYDKIKEYTPSVVWIHDNITDTCGVMLKEFLYNSDDVYVPSELTRSYVLKANKNPKILPYPIQDIARDKEKVQNEKIKVAVCATIQDRKGQDIFVDAINMLPKELNCNVEFIVIGDVCEDDVYNKVKKATCSNKSIILLEATNNLQKYYDFISSIDVLCCPSREDPYPLVVIDALMHSIPVVISDHVGQKEIIENGKNGYVFESENSHDLAVILEQILLNPQSIEPMGKEARKTFLKYFDFETCSKKFKNIMDEKCKKS